MSNPLENYLNQLRSQLKGLPEEGREAEVEEARQHLLALIQERIEAGDSEEVATATAIRQFGNPQTNGKALHSAWRRGNSLGKTLFFRSTLHALLSTAIIGASLFHLFRAVGSATGTGASDVGSPSLPVPAVVAFLLLAAFSAFSLRFAHKLRAIFFGVFAGLMVLNAVSDFAIRGLLPSLYISYVLELILFVLSGVALGMETTDNKKIYS